MNTALGKWIGYFTLNNLFINNMYCVESFYIYNVTLKKHSTFTDKFYRFKKPAYPKQAYDAFLILDFESTCKAGFNAMKDPEIIEFPCLWVNSTNMKIVGKFHRYVKPKISKSLEPFCIQLTGITDDMLKNEKHFDVVLNDFLTWVAKMKESTKTNDTVFITDGNWDLEVMLPKQCSYFDIELPEIFKYWINVREPFHEIIGKYPKNLKEMLILMHIKRQGRLHCGLDDSYNIFKIVRGLAELGHLFV